MDRRTSLARAAAALGALAVLVAGCGLFDPENPPTPGGNETVNLPNLTGGSPDSTFYSLAVGLETKNLQLYQHALAESTVVSDIGFHAFFDAQDLADYSQSATPPTDWTTQDEKTFFSQLASLVPVNSYQFAVTDDDPPRADILGPDEQTWYRHYRLTYAPNQFLAVGLADLTFRRVGVNQEWKLIRWVDRRDTVSSLRTMGRQRLGPPSP